MIPEVALLNQATSLIRIPPADGVPISPRVRRIIDTAPMRRLASISQLGMVSLVYPGATHSRFEHSLGVYLNSLRFLARFADDPSLNHLVDDSMAEAFVLAALLHDVGHWPFCHPMEDMRLERFEDHEFRVSDWILQSELSDCIHEDWHCEIADVVDLLEPKRQQSVGLGDAGDQNNTIAKQFLRSCLSGPVDIDKLDYLQRDSLHAGVPYGHHFDAGRLIQSVCVHRDKNVLAVGEKGRTAAEMMVFARYVMFSEVYWHHAVRAATAMLQRAVFLLQYSMPAQTFYEMTDSQWIAAALQCSQTPDPLDGWPPGCDPEKTHAILDGLFGSKRRLYKRVAQFDAIDGGEVHRQLSRKPYWWLALCCEHLADQLRCRTGIPIAKTDVLIDAPPAKLEVDINVDIIRRDGQALTLADISPVAKALAHRQFDDQVKRVRVFVAPELRSAMMSRLSKPEDWSEIILQSIRSANDEIV